MGEFLSHFFSTAGFLPHGQSFAWNSPLIWTYVVSDVVIALAYFSIPFGISYFLGKRRDMKSSLGFAFVSLFIFACGATHLASVWTLWHPDYWLDATLKAITAMASLGAAAALVPLVPRVLRMPSAAQMRSMIDQLEHQVAERRIAENALETLNDTLEQRVGERTKELLEINRRMEAEIESRKMIERALHNEKYRIQITLESIGDAVITADTAGKVTYLNPVAERMTGWTNAKASGRRVNEVFRVIDEATRQPVINLVDAVLASREPHRSTGSSHHRLIGRDGREAEIEQSAAPLFNHEKLLLGAVLVFHDVTEARKLASQMAHLANHDTLTDLPNRAYLNDKLDKTLMRAQREHKRAALMFIDIDHFKNVNDTLGHDIGDQLLLEIANRLRKVVRTTDIVCRQGGDEFIILLPEVNDKLAPADVARKVIEQIRSITQIGGHYLRVSGSVGIAVFPDDGVDAEVLTRNADSAMYHAKGAGRNNFQFFTRAMTEVVAERVRLEHNLRRAIERNEFVLHYQPKIALTDGRIIGAEVLLRWQHPTDGLISPGQFISAAEQSGLIREIGSWVLREACGQTLKWQSAGMAPVPMAVNLSAIQLHHEGFLEEVTTVLRELKLSPELLEFEVTESVSIHGEEKAVAWLETLRRMGVKLSIDDFGTGYSSLSYLKRLPIDTIKIDQSFIRDITTDPDDAAIITAIIRMAHSLRLNVIAEGVESQAQLDFLRKRNCNQVQGHFFSEPVPAEKFSELLMAQASPA